MRLASVLIFFVTATCFDAVPHVKDEPVCIKTDECSCHLTGVEQPGVIDLHSLVSGEPKPAFIIVAESEHTNISYTYSYNPCSTYDYNFCPTTSICQENPMLVEAYDLGNPDTVKFIYQNNSVFAFYKSKYNDDLGYNRSSEIELVCDEAEKTGKFEYVGEPIERHYKFKLYTRCACPGKCTSSQTECKAKDLCSCEMSDGTGTINLHSLDNATNPLRDEASPTNTFLYNPCSPITIPDCKGNSLCEEKGDSLVGLGMANSAKFVQNNNQLSIQYTGPNNNTATVNLFCDENQRNKPFFRAIGGGKAYDLYSVCACPNGCSGPPSNGTCDQTDSCTCKSTSDGAVINLHDLDNPYAPLTAEDNEGYFYYYNPCSGIKLQNTSGKCNGVAACQYDPYHGVYYDIGNIGPKIHYNATSKSFTFHYTGGQENRSFDVRMICDPDVASTILLPDDDIPKGVTMYPLKLISKYACPQRTNI
ncbi:uncharacterized protein [Dysidea avara]|uniref:uncharacterized protein n=1 Tax=Dysidea avara TaxID=196820 RepID=UPI00331FF34D